MPERIFFGHMGYNHIWDSIFKFKNYHFENRRRILVEERWHSTHAAPKWKIEKLSIFEKKS